MNLRVRDLPSPNHDERPEGVPVDVLVLHYTDMETGAAAIARLRDPEARVSSHYVVEEDGQDLPVGAGGTARLSRRRVALARA